MAKGNHYGSGAVLAIVLSFQALAVGDNGSPEEGQQLPAGENVNNPELTLPTAEEAGASVTPKVSPSRAKWKSATPGEEIEVGVSVPFPADI